MKKCSTCGLEKEFSQFNKETKNKDGLQYSCRDCKKKQYRENRESRLASIMASRERRRKRNQVFIYEYLQNNGCSCGESDPLLLEFDHIDSNLKLASISNMVNDAVSIKKLQSEIDKCRVLCVVCHRRRTAKQFGFWKTKLMPW